MDFVDAEFSVESAPFGRSRSANETGAAGRQPRCINEPLSKPLRVPTRRLDQAEPCHRLKCIGAGAFRTGSDRLAREIVRALTVPFLPAHFAGLSLSPRNKCRSRHSRQSDQWPGISVKRPGANSHEQAKLQMFNHCVANNETMRLERKLTEAEIKQLGAQPGEVKRYAS